MNGCYISKTMIQSKFPGSYFERGENVQAYKFNFLGSSVNLIQLKQITPKIYDINHKHVTIKHWYESHMCI